MNSYFLLIKYHAVRMTGILDEMIFPLLLLLLLLIKSSLAQRNSIGGSPNSVSLKANEALLPHVIRGTHQRQKGPQIALSNEIIGGPTLQQYPIK